MAYNKFRPNKLLFDEVMLSVYNKVQTGFIHENYSLFLSLI